MSTFIYIFLYCIAIDVIALIAIYFMNDYKYPKGKELFWVLIIAPLVIPTLPITVPIAIYAYIKDKKETRTNDIEREKSNAEKERLLQRLRKELSVNDNISEDDISTAISFFLGVSESSYFRKHDFKQMSTRDLNRLKAKLENQLATGEFDEPENESIIAPLDAIHLNEGYTIDYYGPTQNGIGGRCHIFVKANNETQTSDEDADRDFFKYLAVEKSKKGAWQAFLLYTAWHSMPLYWHAYYDEWQRIYSLAQWGKLKSNLINNSKGKEPCFVNWRKLGNLNIGRIKDGLTPKVHYKNDEAFVQCYIWNDFSGIKRYSLYINLSEPTPKFVELEEKTVISCGNGLML